VADAMIQTGAANKALVIGAEVFSRILDFKRPHHLRAVW
jgi:3-oxoacyl-[acyl-carrier-protein] synthase-3